MASYINKAVEGQMMPWISQQSIEQHIVLGNRFKDLWYKDFDLWQEIPPRSVRVGRYIYPGSCHLVKVMGQLNTHLTKIVLRLPGDPDPRDLLNYVYYTTNRLVRSPDKEVWDKHDAFAGWLLINKNTYEARDD